MSRASYTGHKTMLYEWVCEYVGIGVIGAIGES